MKEKVQLINLVGKDEQVLWEGQPYHKTTVLESIFSPLFFFAILWGAVDFGILFFLSQESYTDAIPWYFVIPFFALHLTPVWIYIGSIFKALNAGKNTHYLLTDKALYSLQAFGKTNYHKTLIEDMIDLHTNQGFFDRRIGVGDVVYNIASTGDRITRAIENIEEFYELYEVVHMLKSKNATYEEFAMALSRLQSFQKQNTSKYQDNSNPLDH